MKKLMIWERKFGMSESTIVEWKPSLSQNMDLNGLLTKKVIVSVESGRSLRYKRSD